MAEGVGIRKNKGNIHLRIKEAGSSLNNTNSAIESIDLIRLMRSTGDDSPKRQSQILRMQIVGKAISQSLLLTRRNRDVKSRAGDVPQDG